jgi:steroid delta-isomerase-like uncharacterized protein
MNNLETIKQYYQFFNEGNWEGMLSLVAEDILHYPNQGELRKGKALFQEFLKNMDTAYSEKLNDLVFYSGDAEGKFAASFTVNGIYKIAEEGLPPAHGQSYVLPAAAFLEVKNGQISSVKTYYNLEEWIGLVS